MEILISIGIFALGVITGIVLIAIMMVKESDDFEDVLQDTYDRGFEDGHKEEHQKWLRMSDS